MKFNSDDVQRSVIIGQVLLILWNGWLIVREEIGYFGVIISVACIGYLIRMKYKFKVDMREFGLRMDKFRRMQY